MQENLEGGDAELVETLRRLELAPVSSSAREIWYAAGRRASQRQTRRWKLISAALSLAAGVALVRNAFPQPTVEPLVTVVRVLRTAHPPAALPDSSFANLQASAVQLATLHAVADKGLSALPVSNVEIDPVDFTGHSGGRDWLGDPGMGRDDDNSSAHGGGHL